MRVIPLTSILSHKGRGCRSPKRDDTLSLEIRELFKHPLRQLCINARDIRAADSKPHRGDRIPLLKNQKQTSPIWGGLLFEVCFFKVEGEPLGSYSKTTPVILKEPFGVAQDKLRD